MSTPRDAAISDVTFDPGHERYAVAYRGHPSARVARSFASLATTRIGPLTIVMCDREGPRSVYWVLSRISALGLELVEVQPITDPTAD